MPGLTLQSLPLVFTKPRFRFCKADKVFLIVNYPKAINTRREFYHRRHYTAPFRHSDKRIENVLVGFDDRAQAGALADRLADLYRIECEPFEERMEDVKYYASMIRMPLVVSLGSEPDEIYYYQKQGYPRMPL
jgi:hypothetical protein